jgi:hypothetical protein
MPDPNLLAEPVDEIVVMASPRKWQEISPELREQLAWWQMIRGIQLQTQANKSVIPCGPPDDIEWVFASSVAEVSAIRLRHPCDECRDGLTQAIDALRTGQAMVAVAQFTQRYLSYEGAPPRKFRRYGEL